eukprot:SAG31_NODE_8013_length_1541_cov_1.139390_2_plen_143_part_00
MAWCGMFRGTRIQMANLGEHCDCVFGVLARVHPAVSIPSRQARVRAFDAQHRDYHTYQQHVRYWREVVDSLPNRHGSANPISVAKPLNHAVDYACKLHQACLSHSSCRSMGLKALFLIPTLGVIHSYIDDCFTKKNKVQRKQ